MTRQIQHLVSTKIPHRPFYRHLYVQVILAIIVGILLGHFWPAIGIAMKPFGDGFIKLVKMIITPVIFLTIVSGITGMSNMKSMGRVAGKAMAYFLTFSTLALIIGLVIGNLVQPGAGLNATVESLDAKDIAEVATYAQKARDSAAIVTDSEVSIVWLVQLVMKGVVYIIADVIPNTLFSGFVEGKILQVLFVAVLFGTALAAAGPRGKPVIDLVNALVAPVFKLIGYLMKAAPIGAFGAMAFTIGKFGIGALVKLGFLIGTFYVTSLLFVLVILGAVCRYNGFSILALIRYIKDELLLILGTSSSESALPMLIEKMERAGAKKSVVGLVIPTGYSFNLDGTNIYMTLATLFIAQAFNIPLTFGEQIGILVLAMLFSKGAAGVTGSGFITLAATLTAVPSIPIEGMALILGIDRFMSECRSLTNFSGNAVACIVVAAWEKQLDRDKLHAALSGKIPNIPGTEVTESA
ncbi:MAG: C4-dicarboxylate transport protein [Candidatus Tokpelaia hoelldobleri]|uniref:C4-dicarboxylate transport protein n=1 Tax=Candidatus Tokpelaia hoelldobleri TaxID=1902579 RepID=A0A1U9JVQ7_9HYPH|nr:MAG: C4-dicarboxylate transport protein [Candidatus Tokpelaia hoelldoblerii]